MGVYKSEAPRAQRAPGASENGTMPDDGPNFTTLRVNTPFV